MKLPDSEHRSRPWRIHEIAPDFRLEDVWALPTPGGRRGDFAELVTTFAGGDLDDVGGPTALLWRLRRAVGALLGWDDDGTGPGKRVPSLVERLPADLRGTATADFDRLPFTGLYEIEDEWAAEIANSTMHGVMHLGWVPDGEGGFRGQMAVLVKPNGLAGRAYMAAIKPFRLLVVYPALMRHVERTWRRRTADRTASG